MTTDPPAGLPARVAEVSPGSAPLAATVRVPGSKYEANRLLLIAALTDGASTIAGVPAGDDLRAALAAIPALGATVAVGGIRAGEASGGAGPPGEVRVIGLPAPERVGPGEGAARSASLPAPVPPAEAAPASVGESGTLLRFLTAAAATVPNPVRISGAGRLGERPLSGLVRALRSLGAEIRGPARGNLPLTVRSGHPLGGLAGGRVRLPADETSQFASALLIASGRFRGALDLELESDPVSASYLDLTVQVMERCGATVERRGQRRYRVPAGVRYRPGSRTVTGDWTAASLPFAAAALAPGRVRVLGLDPDSPAGESEFPAVLRRLGCRVEESAGPDGFAVTVTGGAPLRGVEADFSRMPDAAPTLAVLAPFAEGPTRLTGVGHLRHKESDRIEALREGLERLGAGVEVSPDCLTITPPERPPRRPPVFDSRGDHRIAMAFALVGLRLPGVRVRDPGVVAKSFPGYWEFLRGLGLRVRFEAPDGGDGADEAAGESRGPA